MKITLAPVRLQGGGPCLGRQAPHSGRHSGRLELRPSCDAQCTSARGGECCRTDTTSCSAGTVPAALRVSVALPVVGLPVVGRGGVQVPVQVQVQVPVLVPVQVPVLV